MAADGALVVSGRRFSDARTPNLTLEDVAALYQAHKALEQRAEEALEEIAARSQPLIDLFNGAVNAANKYDAAAFKRNVEQLELLLAEWEISKNIDSAGSLFSTNPSTWPETIEDLRERVLARRDESQKEQQAKMLLEGRLPPGEPGFSLDPLWNPKRLLTDLRLILQNAPAFVEGVRAEFTAAPETSPLAQRRFDRTAGHLIQAFDDAAQSDQPISFTQAPEYLELADITGKLANQSGDALEKGAILPFLQLKKRLNNIDYDSDSDTSDADRVMKTQNLLLAILDHIETRNRYQCARYYGPLQGTSVGMNLFYTDLLAKIWAAIDYYGSAPVAEVPGFPRRDYRAIYDVSGDAQHLDTLIGRLAPGGEIVLAGFYGEPLTFAFPPAFMRELRLRVAAEWRQPDLVAVRDLVAAGRLSLAGLITHREEPTAADMAYRTAFGDPACLKMILDWRACS